MVFDVTDEPGDGLGRQQRFGYRFLTHQGPNLQQDDDDTDAAHETGDDRMRYQFDVLANAQHTKQDQEQATEYDDSKGNGRALCRFIRKHRGVLGKDCRHDNGHGPGRTGHLGRGAAEQGGKETDKYRTIQARDRPDPGSDAHGHCQRQGNDGSG